MKPTVLHAADLELDVAGSEARQLEDGR